MKTAKAKLAFWHEQMQSSFEWALAARQRRDPARSVLNFRSAFEEALMIGLINWRHDVATPTIAFRQALETVPQERAATTEAEWKDRMWWGVAAAAFIAYLLNGRFDLDLRAELPARSEWSKSAIEGSGPVLDAGLIAAMAEEKIPLELEALLARMTKNKRVKLAHETYTNYVEIIRRCLADAPIEEFVRRAEELFLKRKRNAYYHSAATEGGGPDNDYVVDYKLAAILKWCESKSPKSKVETIHAWQW